MKLQKLGDPGVGAELVIGLGHICPKLDGDEWSQFEMVEESGDLFSYECPRCRQRACFSLEFRFKLKKRIRRPVKK